MDFRVDATREPLNISRFLTLIFNDSADPHANARTQLANKLQVDPVLA